MEEPGNRVFRFRLVFGQDGRRVGVSRANADLIAFPSAHGRADISGACKASEMEEPGNHDFRFRLVFGQDGRRIGVSRANADLIAFPSAHGCADITGACKAPVMEEPGNRVFRFRLVFGQDGR